MLSELMNMTISKINSIIPKLGFAGKNLAAKVGCRGVKKINIPTPDAIVNSIRTI